MKIVVVLTNQNEESEVVVPIDLWRRAGYYVQTVSAQKKRNLVLQNGLKIVCDDLLCQENLSKYDAIYFPGGQGCRQLLNDEYAKLHTFLQKSKSNSHFYFLAICAAPTIFADLDLLHDVKATCYPTMAKSLPHYCAQRVVCDKNFITSQGPATVFEFAMSVVEKFSSKAETDKLKKEIIF